MYAHWRKCDFQIHTPRDPNWKGPGPLGLGDKDPLSGQACTAQDVDCLRATWAREFIDKCIAKDLRAIAITDHHEMVMYRYVRDAVNARRASDPTFDFWVFPGMELTATGGKQCLLIFDADLSEDWRQQAQGKLGIVFAGLDEKAQRATKVEQLAMSYPDIGACLDELKELRGKYIVLPNVSEGGRYTTLTDGAHAEFLRMPYVGGYLDCNQTINTLGGRNRQRLSGTDKSWSKREIYPLPTSDCRASDYATLGKNDAWIKLAEPTAEAIRQAFLGHKSRIRTGQPQLASPSIVDLTIEGSSILQNGRVALSSELNAVIGGRGSGKSSLLEYIGFALGRSCYDVPREHYSENERMRALIADTLVAVGGQVSITILQDNAAFKITRAPGTAHQPQIRYPNGAMNTISLRELRSLFPAVVYSQGELAEIGKRASATAQLTDLLQFVSPSYKLEDDRLTAETAIRKQAVRTALQAQVAHWDKQATLHKTSTARDSIKQRVEALEKALPALSDADRVVVDRFTRADAFESKRLVAAKHADQIVDLLDEADADLSGERDLIGDTEQSDGVKRHYQALVQSFASGIATLRMAVSAARAELTTAEGIWAGHLKEMRSERDAVLEKLGAHKTVTDQIIKLGQEISDHTNTIAELEAELAAAGDAAATLKTALDDLRAGSSQQAKRTQEWAQEIERLSSGKIKASVELAGDTSEMRDAIDALALKTGSQQATRLQAWDLRMIVDEPDEVIDHLRTDCLALIFWRQLGSPQGSEQPECATFWTLLGSTDNIRASMLKLIDLSRVEAIATAIAKPQISLFYRDGKREVSFDKASEGQRAAALLFMLLEQSGGPLVIDQPESDLDNKIIAELTDKLHVAKERRQLIFASHNANIVVNGSSELVACLDVADGGARHIALSGAIDTPEICSVITATMEGGEKAFKDRQHKYGY